MQMDDWHTNREAAAAALRKLQAAMDSSGIPEESWRQIRLMMGGGGLNDVQIGGLTVAAAEQLTRALAAVPQQRTVPDAGDDEPDRVRAHP